MSNFQNKIEKNKKGVWRYANFYDEFIKPENRLNLDDKDNKKNNGGTREIEIGEINKLLKIGHLYFKREDENETGSLKDRSLVYQISLAKQNSKKELVISTSGNAGIAAAAYCQKAKIKLYVFISPETEKAKIFAMQKYKPIIIKSKKAMRLANYLSAKHKIENLRPSLNDSSIEGFKSIAFEIFENLGKVEAIFTFVTSGSSLVGIGRAYQYLLNNREIKEIPKLYAVQSGDIFSVIDIPISPRPVFSGGGDRSEFLTYSRKIPPAPFNKGGTSERGVKGAGRLGTKNTRRKKEIIELIKSSSGRGIYVNDDEIIKAGDILKSNNIFTSPEGRASLAGAIKASEENKFNKIVCILSGKLRKDSGEIDENKIYRAENFEEVDGILADGRSKHAS